MDRTKAEKKMRIKLRMKKKRDKSNQVKIPKKSLYAVAAASVFAMIWVNIGSLTKFGLQIELPESNIPTLINGITTSTSLVIGIFIAILGIMLRSSIEKKDYDSKHFYLYGMISLMIPVLWLWTTYVFLTQGFYKKPSRIPAAVAAG